MVQLRRLALWGLAGMLAAMPAGAFAHERHSFGSPFHPLGLDDGLEYAKQEHRVLLVHASPAGFLPPDYLQKPTWKDWQLIDLLICETVAIALNVREHPQDIERLTIGDRPEFLVLNADGSTRLRLSGELSAEELVQTLGKELIDDDAVARIKAAIAGGKDEEFARERLADVLRRRGEYEGAHREYEWCVRQGLRANVLYAAARRRLLLTGFVELGQHYPAAAATLRQLREEYAAELVSGKGGANRARDLAAMDKALDQPEKTLEVFDAEKISPQARAILFDRVMDQLVAAGRQDDVLRLVKPLRAFQQEVRMAYQRKRLWSRTALDAEQRGTPAFATERGALLVEALARADRSQEARELIDAVLKFDDSATSRAQLQRHIERSGNTELLTYLTQTAQPATQP